MIRHLVAVSMTASLALAGCASGSSDPGPAGRTSPAAVTGIPDGFPLDLGFAAYDGQVEGPTRENLGTMPLDVCGDFYWSRPSERLDTWISGDDFGENRELVYYRDVAEARDDMARLRKQAAACHEQVFTDRSGMTSTVTYTPLEARVGDGAEAVGLGNAVTEEAGSAWLAVRRGPAIVLLATSAAPGRRSDTLASQLETNARSLYGAMCAFTDDCTGTESSPPPRVVPEDPSTRIPDDFPLTLDQHAATGDGGELTGPGPKVIPDLVEICDNPLFTIPARDRLASVATGPESADGRQVTTYGSVAEAEEQMKTIRGYLADFRTCGTGDDALTWHPYQARTGAEETLTFGSTYDVGTGGQTVQVVRVGLGILTLSQYGEFTPESQRAFVPELTDRTRRILPAMCAFTAAGC